MKQPRYEVIDLKKPIKNYKIYRKDLHNRLLMGHINGDGRSDTFTHTLRNGQIKRVYSHMVEEIKQQYVLVKKKKFRYILETSDDVFMLTLKKAALEKEWREKDKWVKKDI